MTTSSNHIIEFYFFSFLQSQWLTSIPSPALLVSQQDHVLIFIKGGATMPIDNLF